jgi:hypothetical protein
VYGVHTLTQRFVIGRSLIAVANTHAHHVKIYRDQHLFATWPMSAGRPGDDTPNGTYLTMAKTNPEEMVGPGYDIEVPWSVRFTLGRELPPRCLLVGRGPGVRQREPRVREPVPGERRDLLQARRTGRSGDDHWEPAGWDVGETVGPSGSSAGPRLLEGSALHQAVRAGPMGSSFVERAALRPPHAKAPLGTSRPGNADATPG